MDRNSIPADLLKIHSLSQIVDPVIDRIRQDLQSPLDPEQRGDASFLLICRPGTQFSVLIKLLFDRRIIAFLPRPAEDPA